MPAQRIGDIVADRRSVTADTEVAEEALAAAPAKTTAWAKTQAGRDRDRGVIPSALA